MKLKTIRDEVNNAFQNVLVRRVLKEFANFREDLSYIGDVEDVKLTEDKNLSIKMMDKSYLLYDVVSKRVIQNKGGLYKKVKRILKKYRDIFCLYFALSFYSEVGFPFKGYRLKLVPFNIMDNEATIKIASKKVVIRV